MTRSLRDRARVFLIGDHKHNDLRALVLVALVTVGTPAVADIDPAVMAMLRQWSVASPNTSRVVICHGFGCAFRTAIALTDADHAQMAAIMASGGCLD